MATNDAERCRSDEPAECPATSCRVEIADGDIVRCDIAPYFFRAHASGAALRLEPIEDRFTLVTQMAGWRQRASAS